MTTMEDISQTFLSLPLWMTFLIAVVPLYFFTKPSKAKNIACDIPWAPGQVPLLGHALEYQKDPSGFLLRMCQSVGTIFQLNLAGKHMIVVAGPEEQRQVAQAPERILSARQAVAEIGFEETLGPLSVSKGTDIHKRLVKGIWQKNTNAEFCEWKKTLVVAIDTEIALLQDGKVELFHLTRRVLLRSVLDRMVGPTFLSDGDDPFLKDFMHFQDRLEDVTAKSVVLPRWLAGPALLQPVRRERERLQKTIQKRLERVIAESSAGFWLEGIRQDHALEDVSEYLVGLLFAAHKNPSIGASQAYLFLYERLSKEDQDACQEDARKFLDDAMEWQRLEESCPSLRRLCLETLRLTAHSIGAVRKVQEDFEIEVKEAKKTYVIPKGLSISLTHITPSLNPKLWGDKATEMNLHAHDKELYQDEYKFTTFSHGVHKCPGQQLSLVMLQCLVATFLQVYDVKLPSKLPPISFERATLAQRDGPVMVTVKKRL